MSDAIRAILPPAKDLPRAAIARLGALAAALRACRLAALPVRRGVLTAHGACAANVPNGAAAVARATRKAERHAFDRYYTPTWAAAALLDTVAEIGGKAVLDPCSGGDGAALLRVLAERFGSVVTNDIDASLSARYHYDATRAAFWDLIQTCEPQVSWVVCNPPFRSWALICHRAVTAGYSVACLLRIAALEAIPARHWLVTDGPRTLVILPRIRFRSGSQTDSCCYVWAIWSRSVPAGVRYADPKHRQKSFHFGEAAA